MDRPAEPVSQAEVPRRALRLVVLKGLVLVVIAFTLDLERERRPGRLVLHAAEERGRAPEPGVVAGSSAFADIGWPSIELRAEDAQRVAQVATGTDVAPTEPEVPVERT